MLWLALVTMDSLIYNGIVKIENKSSKYGRKIKSLWGGAIPETFPILDLEAIKMYCNNIK